MIREYTASKILERMRGEGRRRRGRRWTQDRVREGGVKKVKEREEKNKGREGEGKGNMPQVNKSLDSASNTRLR